MGSDKRLPSTAGVHEHPAFNGSYHQAVWAYSWVSGNSNDVPLAGTPVQCLICGVVRNDDND